MSGTRATNPNAKLQRAEVKTASTLERDNRYRDQELTLMLQRTSTIILLALLSCGACFGQSTYTGLTPGRSTRAEAERVLGRPVKELSKTLAEYRSTDGAARLYVQYRDESPAAVVERIELTCPDQACGETSGIFKLRPPDEILRDVMVMPPSGLPPRPPYKQVWYWGAPRFIVFTALFKPGDNPLYYAEVRLGFYSKELYESAVPSCIGTILGTWESTGLGRMNIVREGDYVFRGTYSKNDGSFTLDKLGRGNWKDDTGSGTIRIEARDGEIVVFLRRTAGTGRETLVEVARCVKAQGSNQ
jgi:hypothetical protein